MSFGFNLSFRSPPGRTLRGVGAENDYVLTLPGVVGSVVLRQVGSKSDHATRLPEKFVLGGSGFADEAAARSCGERLKQALAVVGCETQMGIDVGRDQRTAHLTDIAKEQLRKEFGCQVRDSIHGLDVFPEEPPVVYFGGEGHGSADYAVDHFPDKLSQEFTAIRLLNSKLALALELYNLAQFEPGGKARFLTLVSIVEVLGERARRSQDIRAQLDEFARSIRNSSLGAEEKESLLNGLGNLKRESIGAACRRLIAEHLGDEAATYFSACYNARSELLHDGETNRAEIHHWGRLDEIVRSVLLKKIRNAEQGG